MQQIGIMTTSAAKAGFLTSLYLVLVPLIGLFFWKEDQQMGLVRGPISYVGSFLSLSRHATDHTTRRCLHGHWRALLGNADTGVGPF